MRIAFGDFLLDTSLVELRRGERAIPLEPKSFDLLVLLAENRDRVVSRDEIFDRVWPGIFVTEASLSTAIAGIRRALSDDGKAQKFVKTIRGRGFRFVADVQAPPAGSVAASALDTPVDTADPTDNRAGGPPVVAVLPFTLIATDDTHRAIAEAIPTELIATLAKLKSVRVIARGSAFRFTDPHVALDDIRAKLGAKYVLSGSVELVAGRLSIIVELTDAQSRHVVWSESYTGKIDDVFELRALITRELANILELRLALHEAQSLDRVPSENLDAWGHYHLGVRAMYHYNHADNEAAGTHFARAVALDPNFARAHGGLSYTEFQNYFQQFGDEFKGHRSRALQHAEDAVRLDPLDPYGNLMLGRAKWVSGEVDDGLSWVDRSLTLSPNYSFALYNSALLNTVLCDGETAETHVASALVRSPLDPHMQTMLGTRALAAFVRDDHREALRYAQKAMYSPNAHLHVYIIAAAIQSTYGQAAKAKRALDEIRKRNVPIDKSGFFPHFELRDPERRKTLVASLERLDL